VAVFVCGARRQNMRRGLMAAGVILCGLMAPAAGFAQKPVDLAVTVTYTGKGAVDATHEILVFLFTNPNISAESEPVGVQTITKSGGTATFTAVPHETVYVVMVYDEKSNYDGQSGPPPVGAPIGNYGKAGKILPVKPGSTPKIKATFDDSVRWK
jgi:hypothetical protein